MQLIDTHVHINFDRFKEDLEQVVGRWRQQGVSKLVHSCVHPDEFETISALAQAYPELYCSVGLHPLDHQKWAGEITAQKILNFAQSHPKVVAIGEMGLDFFKDQEQEKQKEICWRQLEIAYQLNKPVIIHCREAGASFRDLLTEFLSNKGQIKGVMHCWTGTPEETQWFLDLGMYISFSGVVTFKNAKTVHNSALLTPLDRLLIETDCPFLAPSPHRGDRNEPAYVYHVAERLAELKGIDLSIIAQHTTQNAETLFNLT
ncbi:MAG: TatD family hydrolase [Cyanobacterium sp. T60_A2020_053]|nr:TatD family hydrolase [Cyanobacterium sp. T60_A2020_053]